MATFIVGAILWLFAIGLFLYVIHSAIKPHGLIQKSDRFYSQRPRIAFAIMLFICAVVLYVAHQFDVENDNAIRWGLMTRNGT